MQPQNASQICISSSHRTSQHKHLIREEKGNKSLRLIVYEGKKQPFSLIIALIILLSKAQIHDYRQEKKEREGKNLRSYISHARYPYFELLCLGTVVMVPRSLNFFQFLAHEQIRLKLGIP